MSYLLTGAVAVVLTLIAVFFTLDYLRKAEDGISLWFERVTTRPRWFTIWLLVAILWVPSRVLLREHYAWYSADVDNVVAVILWSVAPFMVENVMKTATARAMDLLLDLARKAQQMLADLSGLTVSVREELDRARERDELIMHMQFEQAARDAAMFALVERLVEHFEYEGGDENGHCLGCAHTADTPNAGS